MNLLPVGRRRPLAEVTSPQGAVALAAGAASARWRARSSPGAETVLFDGVTEPESLADALAGWRGGSTATGAEVEIAVTYDGPDLEAVAAHWGCAPDEVGARHRATEFVSAFCGFSPGFAYLSARAFRPAARDAAHPGAGRFGRARRDLVRCLSGGLAGWLAIIGHTTAVLWDPDRPAPHCSPGHAGQVRGSSTLHCRETWALGAGAGPRLASAGRTSASPEPGPGRAGRRAGSPDRRQPRRRRRARGAAGGLAVTADRGVWVAVTGAPRRSTAARRGRPRGVASRGRHLRLGPPSAGLRSYLAVAGGILVEPVLGSRSTDTLGRSARRLCAAATASGGGAVGRRSPVDTPPAPDPARCGCCRGRGPTGSPATPSPCVPHVVHGRRTPTGSGSDSLGEPAAVGDHRRAPERGDGARCVYRCRAGPN